MPMLYVANLFNRLEFICSASLTKVPVRHTIFHAYSRYIPRFGELYFTPKIELLYLYNKKEKTTISFLLWKSLRLGIRTTEKKIYDWSWRPLFRSIVNILNISNINYKLCLIVYVCEWVCVSTYLYIFVWNEYLTS